MHNILAFAKTQTEIALKLIFPDSLSTPPMLAHWVLKKDWEKLWAECKGTENTLCFQQAFVAANSCTCEVNERATPSFGE